MAIPNHASNINPTLAAMLFDQTHMPTLGRRNLGLGSAFYPGGPMPIHLMNRLFPSMAVHGTSGSPFGAGHYPFPQQPIPGPWTFPPNPMVGPGFPGPGPGGLSSPPPLPPFMPDPTMGLPGPGMLPPGLIGGGGLGFGGPMGPGMGGLLGMGGIPGMGDAPGLGNLPFYPPTFAGSSIFSSDDGDYDDDDSSGGVWYPDADEDDPFVAYWRASRKDTKKGRKKDRPQNTFKMNTAMFGLPHAPMGIPMGMGMGMDMGMGMGVPFL